MIQWYPGHMAKARRILKDDLKLVDLVIEVLDARIPESSRNPELKQLLTDQERLIVLNKIDLASKSVTEQWLNYYKKKLPVLKANSVKGDGIKRLLKMIEKYAGKINEKVTGKGRKSRDIRIMIVGVPNVGKSALINVMAGSNISKTGNKPGVTRGRQWIKVGNKIQLLDTPGILWPKFDDEDVGYKLAITNAIKDKIFDEELAAYKLIEYILKINKKILEKKYKIMIDTDQPYDILPLIGKKTGCLMSGGRVDRMRASKKLINDYRRGKIGRVTLEKPEGVL